MTAAGYFETDVAPDQTQGSIGTPPGAIVKGWCAGKNGDVDTLGIVCQYVPSNQGVARSFRLIASGDPVPAGGVVAGCRVCGKIVVDMGETA